MKKHYTIYTILFIVFLSVTVQAQTVFRGTVIDAVTKQPIANARVGINNQGVGEITDGKGFFNYKKYHEVISSESQLMVGASGYESLQLDAKEVRLLFNRSSKIELQPSSNGKEKKAVKNLTIFWDVSEDMKGRDVAAEIAYVQAYVSMHKDLRLRLVVFDYKIRTDERMEIRNGDISRFRESVKALIYNGPSNYDVLDITGADAVILSSNGNPNYGTLNVSQDIPVYAIASQDIEVNEAYLELLGQYTQGVYRPIQSGEGNTVLRTSSTQVFEGATIKGTITSLGKPLQEVSIIKKGELTEYLTKADGTFELPAKEGDILQLQYLGMFPKDILIENQDDVDIELLPKNDTLEEVVIESRYKQIIVGDKYVRGEKYKKFPGGMTSRGDFFLTSEDIEPKGLTLDEVIRLNFSNNIKVGFGQNGRFFIVAGAGPQWVLDGRPLTLNQEEPPFYLQDFEIESIIVKESKYSTFRFGPEVRGPAIIVTTKKVPLAREKYVDSGLVKNNEYTEEVSSISDGVIAGKIQVKGKVTSLGKPLQEVSIIKKGDLTEYLTKADGTFELPAKEGDILQLQYLGMFPKDVLVSGKTMTVELFPENDVLDEVVIEKKIEKIIVGDKEIRGRKVSPYVPGGVTGALDRYITADDITPNAKTLAYVIRDNFKRARIVFTSQGERVLIKEQSPSFYINGAEVQNIDQALAILDKDIESIIIKDSPITTSRYGPIIPGLAVIITTKSVDLSKKKRGNSALVKGNDYTEEVATIKEGVIASSLKQIKGKVTSLGKPIQGATISVKGSFEEFTSQQDGSFTANLSEGDVLAINYLGMYPKLMVVPDDTRELEIELLPKSDMLDEVEITGKTKRTSNKRVDLETGTYKDPFLGTFDVQTLTKEDDNIESWANLAFGLTGKFSNVTVDTRPGFESIRIRGSAAQYYINGTPVDAIQFFAVNPQNIATISVKRGVGGLIGRSILIDTVDFVTMNSPVPSALVKGNDYEEEVRSISGDIVASKLKITGKVTSLGKPIQGATINKKGTFEEYTSKADGSFTLPSNKGEEWIVYYLGMYPKSFVIDGKTSYTVDLVPKNNVLDEVVLNAKGKEKEEEKVQTAWGKENKDKLGYDVKVLRREDIFQGAPDLGTVLNGRFAGITAVEDSRLGLTVSGRNGPMLIVIDGSIFTPDTSKPFISPDRVESISVIKSTIGALRYGSIGRGGVVEITTSNFASSKAVPIPSPLVEGNEYEEEVKTLEASALNQSSKMLVTGVVKDLKGFLADVTITRKGSFDEVFTDAQGRFEIKASLGNVLVVSKAGMFTKEVLVESQEMGIITLTPKNDELDEVIVSGDKRVDNTIEGSDGRRIDKDKLGYAADELTENDFSSGATNLQQLITGKVAGVSVEGGLYSGSQVVYKIRGGNQSILNEIPPIWIVNGIPYPDPPDFLDVQQIASITVLKSTSATSRYGTLAAGGAFLIKTKEVSFQDKAKEAQKSALVSGNEYTEDSTRKIDTSTLPEYILRLREVPNLQEQFELYQRISRTQESPLEFYVDVAQYFDGINKDMADQVRADLAYISRNNTKALRTLCYIYEAAGDYDKAALIYERILKLAPSEAQSYRDLALIYQEIGKYNQALELYYNMLGEQIMGVDFKGLEKSIKNELSHLLALHKDKVDYERFPNEWLRIDFDIDIRMVIDWSDRSVPFEFQFVNPDKKFFKWSHTLQETRDRLEEEQTQGYQSEEFIIDDAPPGEWLINIQYLGDEGDYVLPPFMKYTVYKNYGTPQETKEIKVVKLFKQSDKVTLGKVVL